MGWRRWTRLGMILAFGGWAGAAGLGASDQTAALQNEHLRVGVQARPFRLNILDRSGQSLLELVGAVRFTTVRGQASPYAQGQAEPWTEAGEVVGLNQEADRLRVDLAAKPGGPALVRITAFFPNDRSLRVEGEVIDQPEVNRFTFQFGSVPEDRYYGLGERFESSEHRGQKIGVWCEEAHIGLGRLSKLAGDKPYNPWPHGPTTWFPVPFFLNPRGYGFLLDDTHYSEFDFGKHDPQTLEITNWNRRFNFIVFYGPKPLEVIEAYTAFTGRITPAAPWVFGVWNAAADKQARLQVVAETTRREHIPTSAIWSEDWSWPGHFLGFLVNHRFQWDLNRNRYPDYEQTAAQLHRDGFRFLGYFMPYLGKDSPAAHDAAGLGYLTKAPEGGPAYFRWLVPKVVQVDLTNPAARQWWEKTMFQKAADLGMDGWMHDFSEYTPTWSVSSDGRDGWAVHNDYPRLWAQTGREFWDQARPDGDWVFFMRAGYTGSWKYAPAMWTGDQNMDWEHYDGIPSVIPAALSVGISGSPVASTDIAGYHCLPIIDSPSDKELFFRWTELGALLPVMRIHESSGCAKNWLFDTDRETLELWKKYASLHTALFPYIYTLVQQAAEHGWPVARHLMLHYPDDPGSLAEEYEFLLGDRVLVAPVIVNRAREREVYFPPGEWVSYWDGKHFQGPARVKVPAPLEEIPLFVKAGTLVPEFDSPIDTLVKVDRPDLHGWDDANRSIKARFFGEGEDTFTLWDGSRIHCRKVGAEPGSCQVSGSPQTRVYSFQFQ